MRRYNWVATNSEETLIFWTLQALCKHFRCASTSVYDRMQRRTKYNDRIFGDYVITKELNDEEEEPIRIKVLKDNKE